ncbi:DUF4089 domain-containing protein [Ancylobacter mangrovi]|uniref:DUF4089 domain-containing protein n=1 Tax=Ancylobacter mangrovi TaxID=2972472 RepID=UPI00216146BB|nr:DUF4089 domain-containing protein [Ancylobacter mangrovi]MCS0501029.1 DUF4089 domain-containing protein [Ancylobacter mangrovi]
MDGRQSGGGGEAGAFLDTALAVMELPLEPELRPRVVMHLETALAMARLVSTFPLPDEAEPAPVYQPGDAEAGSVRP